MASPRKTYRRRELLSYPRVQLKIIIVFAIIAVAGTLTTSLISRNAVEQTTAALLSVSLCEMNPSGIRAVYEQENSRLDLRLMLVTFFWFFILGAGSIHLSHKIAGPMFRLKKYFTDVARGEARPMRLKFRKLDFFAELADSLNQFQQSQGLIPPDGAGHAPASQVAAGCGTTGSTAGSGGDADSAGPCP